MCPTLSPRLPADAPRPAPCPAAPQAESIRANELDKTLNKLGDGLTNKQKKVGGRWGGRPGLQAGDGCGWLRLQLGRHRAGLQLLDTTAVPAPVNRPTPIAPASPSCLQVIEELSKGIVNKLLHGPMTALRCDGADPSAVSGELGNKGPLPPGAGGLVLRRQALLLLLPRRPRGALLLEACCWLALLQLCRAWHSGAPRPAPPGRTTCSRALTSCRAPPPPRPPLQRR